MARTWLSITVELLGGRGEDLWPPPGRTFAVGPSHTFMDLADAINTAFARWDRAHLSDFTLPDGTLIADLESSLDLVSSGFGPVQLVKEIERTKVAKTVELGDEFRFVFDLGDNWVHRCKVHPVKVDPVETLGIRPKTPLPYWGWGDIPDQYGRRWASDDGEAEPDPQPNQPHPMQDFRWPAPTPLTRADLREVRKALAARDDGALLTAITGRDIDDALQQIAVGAPLLLQSDDEQMQALVLSFVNRLISRALPGDQVLGEEILARLRGETPPGREVRVDLGMLSAMLDDSEHVTGAYVDLETGIPIPTGDGLVDAEDSVDGESDPNRYLWLDRFEARDRWDDRMAFAAQQRDPDLRRRLETALDGKGAFQAFRAAVEEAELEERWFVFSADIELGRTRARLAEHDISAVLP